MPNRQEHERNVREVAAEFGATVSYDGGQHLRVTGKGWFVTFAGTPKNPMNKDRVRARIKNATKRLAVKKIERMK